MCVCIYIYIYIDIFIYILLSLLRLRATIRYDTIGSSLRLYELYELESRIQNKIVLSCRRLLQIAQLNIARLLLRKTLSKHKATRVR